MREATLGGLSASDDMRPRRPAGGKPATPARGRTRASEGRWARFRRLRARVALIVGSAGFSAIMIGIVLNATVMQKGHHPAPLFVGAAPAPAEPATPPPPAVANGPAPAPAPDPIAALADPPPVPAAPPAPRAPRAPIGRAATSKASKPGDGIARLLVGTSPKQPVATKPSHPKPAPTASAQGRPIPLHPAAPAKPKLAGTPPKRSLPLAANPAPTTAN